MGSFLKVVFFSLLVLGIYTLFANKYIPEMKPALPPAEDEIDLRYLTIENFISTGETIFTGKGTCTLCHNPVGGRAPLLDVGGKDGPPIGVRAEQRIKDPRYKGKAKTGDEYIRESMVEPSAFVVAGFGVKGTNDTESPMPDVSTGAIGLKPFEIDAVIAYLQQRAGVPITVQIPKEGSAEGDAGEEKTPVAAPAKTPEEVITKYGCGACHKIAGQAGAIGPDLTKIGAKRRPDHVRTSILDPNAEISKDCPTGTCPPDVMPQDYGDKMTAKEFDMLINYLSKSR